MRFLHEKQTQRFYLFLAGVLALQTCCLGICGIFQVRNTQRILVERELAAASYLLEAGIPPGVVALAFNQREGTEEGAQLLEAIGHTEGAQNYLLLLVEQTSVPLLLLLLWVGIVFAAAILGGAAIFFRRRERTYEEAERVIAQYAENRFEERLPTEQTGSLYQLFGGIEQLAQSLQAKNEMEQKTKAFLKDMISNISHQLKTPLAALNMYMEIIMEEPGNEKAVKNFSGKSMQSLERMEQLIQSLLKMARLDAGNIVFKKRRCLISEIVEEALGDLRERAAREDKKILTKGRPEEILFCDREWTKEAVGNLVKNALDYTGAGGVIRIGWERAQAILRLTVEDNGNGIREEDIHHIFKRFYRSGTPGNSQGAGLGLSLAKSIVEEQGGNLSVESRLGEGSAFRMTFLTEL